MFAGVFSRPLRLPLRCSNTLQLRRAFATPAEPSDLRDESLDKKPRKSTTPLRRSASASLPIRANPTPTRSAIQPVFTLATAERYLLSRMRGVPALPAHSQKFHEAWWVPRWGRDGKEGEVFVFANGSFVCWGLEEDEAHRFAVEVIGRVPGIEVSPLKVGVTHLGNSIMDWLVFLKRNVGRRNRRTRIRRGPH